MILEFIQVKQKQRAKIDQKTTYWVLYKKYILIANPNGRKLKWDQVFENFVSVFLFATKEGFCTQTIRWHCSDFDDYDSVSSLAIRLYCNCNQIWTFRFLEKLFLLLLFFSLICLLRKACSYPDYSVCSVFSAAAVAVPLADANALIQLCKCCFINSE